MDVPGVALITGAASGIGRATAKTFALDGARGLALFDLNADALAAVKREIEEEAEDETAAAAAAAGGKEVAANGVTKATNGDHKQQQKLLSARCRVETFPVDVSNEEQITQAVAAAAATFGRLDYVVNAAGTAMKHPGGAAHVETRDWQRILDINLTGTFFVLRAAARIMLAQKAMTDDDSSSVAATAIRRSAARQQLRKRHKGSIVNVSSIQGVVGIPLSTAYAVSKHGVVGLTRTASEDYAAQGLRINAVCPGYTETPLTTSDPNILRAMQERVAGAVPMERMAAPEEIADAIVWLSGGRSSFVTGTTLMVDGGFTQR